MKLLRYSEVHSSWIGKILVFSVVSAIAMTGFVLDASALTLSPIVSTAPDQKPYSIAVDQGTGDIFVVVGQLDPTAPNGISRVTGSTLTPVYSNIGMNYTNGLTAGDGWLYWGNCNIGPYTSSVNFKATQDGSSPIINMGSGSIGDLSDITYSNGFLYTTDYYYGRMRKLDTNGNYIQWLGQTPNWTGHYQHYSSIAVSSDRIFQSDQEGSNPGAIYSYPITGGTGSLVASGYFSNITYFDDTIYAIGSDYDSIWQVPASGGSATLLLGGEYFGNLSSIEAYNGMLYVTDSGSQTIWEVDLYGEPIPEPATMLLLGSGLIGLAGLRRKKFKK